MTDKINTNSEQFSRNQVSIRSTPKQRRRCQVRNPTADRLVTSGLSLAGIARKCKWKDRRWTYEYFKKTNQLELFYASKPGYLGDILSLIQSLNTQLQQQFYLISQMAQSHAFSKASDVEKKTFEFFQKMPRSRYRWTTLEDVLTRYYAAKMLGEKKSIYELCEGLDISLIGFSRVLKTLGLETLYKGQRRVTPHEKDAILRASLLGLSIADIAYFLPPLTHPTIVRYTFLYRGPRSKKKFDYLGPVRTHRRASEIFYAIDAGLNVKEAAEYCGTTTKKVNYAIENRQIIEPAIFNILRAIYPDKNIDKPYLEELL